MGAGLLAMAVGQPPATVTGLSLSRASPLPQGICAGQRILAPPQIKCGRFYGFGEAPKTAFDWYSLRFFMSEKAMRASLRPMMTRA